MKISIAFITWGIAIFIWLYLIPILIIGTLICMPFFIVITPIVMTITCTIAYLLKDEMIAKGKLREFVNNIPYHLWFGKVASLDAPTNPTLICSHPHGILCTGILFSMHFRPASNTLFAVSKWLFHVPLIGWLAKQLGCIPATYKHIEKGLQTHSVILVPGGVPELISGKPYVYRYGFLKIARKMNVSILPVVTDQSFYDIVPCPVESLRIYIAKQYDLPIMFPVLGWYGTWLPKRNPIQMISYKSFVVSNGTLEDERKRYYQLIDMIK